MHPEFLTFGGFTIYWYGVMLAAALVAGLWLALLRAERFGFKKDDVYDSLLPLVISSLVGAKLAFLGVAWREVIADPSLVISTIRGGLVFYGGLAGGILGGILWLRRRKLPVLAFGDLGIPGVALGQAVGRLGCFMNGCCYGRPSSYGMVFPSLGDSIPRLPVQLLESLVCLGLALTLARIPPAPPGRTGRILGLYLMGYGILRFMLEFLRDDPRGTLFGIMSVSQGGSLLAMVAGLVLLRYTARRTA